MKLHWQVSGNGSDIVLVHGWGMNGAVWNKTVEQLQDHHRVHVVDLPGYGHSAHCDAETLEEIASQLIELAPKNAIWIGWSLGGLVATYMALYHKEYVSKLITVASSPKFSADKPWRGIQSQVLIDFTDQLLSDFQLTIERFMALQAMGSPTARQDVKSLKQAVLSRPEPNLKSLVAGLSLLAEEDLRPKLMEISVPFLRLYGRLDGLVPIKVASDMDSLASASHKYIFTGSSHAPFITEGEEFCQQVLQFCR
ncbi:pimeloyl-ACP methyl ester esterase BioH [Vibrio sp. RC27]